MKTYKDYLMEYFSIIAMAERYGNTQILTYYKLCVHIAKRFEEDNNIMLNVEDERYIYEIDKALANYSDEDKERFSKKITQYIIYTARLSGVDVDEIFNQFGLENDTGM